ncbi:DUF2270 domain-containing protein [Poseidonocella sp. HB161398]|uniref:DUF2270 domain-containing protein n=1 Tax=Poseidonocella sp. HB161398 TaxID=2320855 RepID=UPI001109ED32|nr:DUF2270 domain-containing protein [Poseidonocella sp. HB161398]
MAQAQPRLASASAKREFTQAEIGALAHLYRGEVYRSTIWRTRLDTTTNWSVVTLGVALSITFASPGASELPLLLVGVLIALFMVLEARRYRYFNVWRARARWMETHFYAPMLDDGDLHTEENWQKVLAKDYWRPEYHVSMTRAMGRRIRRNYLWILSIQFLAYLGKLIVHPVPASGIGDVVARAAIGPAPGWLVLAFGGLYLGSWLGLAEWVRRRDSESARRKGGGRSLG